MVQDPNFEQPKVSPEQKSSVEISTEQSFDSNRAEQIVEQESTQTAEQAASLDAAAAAVASQAASQPSYQPGTAESIHHDVESVLAEGMDSVFLSLDPGTQQRFKMKGEEVSSKITKLLLEAKIKIKEITNLILDWLRIIPRVNKHYLEQEAKIKTEKILKIKEKNNQ